MAMPALSGAFPVRTAFRFRTKDQGECAMEMHSQRSLYEIHGISAPLRRQSRWSRIARRAIARLLATLKKLRTAIEAELAARRAITELSSMNDQMLRDIGITRGEIWNTVRWSRASVGTKYEPFLSNDDREGGALPTIGSPELAPGGRPEAQLQRLRSR
jgi:uncharacterized protein YjiS (DUF1127 family)